MSAYKPHEFWERSHSNVSPRDVNRGFGIHHVGGGQSDSEAAAMYQLRRINANRVFRKCGLPPNSRIFELGSGGGYWIEFFRPFKPSAFVGSDLSGTAVERLSLLHPDCQFITMETPDQAWSRIESLGPYDLSLAIDVLYHITDDNVWANTLNNLCANTAASGLLLIADYFYEQPTDKPSTVHVKFRPMQAYLNLLDRNGFSAEQVQPVFYFMTRIVSGPWRDHNKLFSPVLRFLTSNSVGLKLIGWVDAAMTAFLRPMNPRCKTRFLLARKAAGV